jgi:hypothetical protein
MKKTALKRGTSQMKRTAWVKKIKPKVKNKRPTPHTRPKASRVKTLKKKLWAIFSQYIRKKHADQGGWLTTVDGVRCHWKECDCGHLRHNSERNALLGGNELWYYENNFAPQSNQGNRLNADDSAQKYMLWAIKKYGTEEIDKMFKMKQTYKLWTEEELVEKYEYYKDKFDRL